MLFVVGLWMRQEIDDSRSLKSSCLGGKHASIKVNVCGCLLRRAIRIKIDKLLSFKTFFVYFLLNHN